MKALYKVILANQVNKNVSMFGIKSHIQQVLAGLVINKSQYNYLYGFPWYDLRPKMSNWSTLDGNYPRTWSLRRGKGEWNQMQKHAPAFQRSDTTTYFANTLHVINKKTREKEATSDWKLVKRVMWKWTAILLLRVDDSVRKGGEGGGGLRGDRWPVTEVNCCPILNANVLQFVILYH